MPALLDQLPDELRIQALTHPAFARTHAELFERLEFLGDSVLALVVTEAIFVRHPDLAEGELTRVRAATVSCDACAQVAREQGLGEAMVAHAEGGGSAHHAIASRLVEQRNALAAIAESVIGAGFRAHGYAAVAPVVLAAFEGRIDHAMDNRVDAKSRLQELASRDGAQVEYQEVGETGPPHDRRFTAAAVAAGARAEGTGRSKQEAQQRAAASLLESMDRDRK